MNLHNNLADLVYINNVNKKASVETYKQDNESLNYVPKNTMPNVDYKCEIKNAFPWLTNEAFNMIAANLDNAMDKATKLNFIGYYTSYASFIFNRLKLVNDALITKSKNNSDIYSIIKDYKVLYRLDDYLKVCENTLGSSHHACKFYEQNALDVERAEGKKLSKLKIIYSSIIVFVMLIVALLFKGSDMNFIVPSIACILSLISLFIINAKAASVEEKSVYNEETQKHSSSNVYIHTLTKDKVYKNDILSDEEFVYILTSKSSIGYDLCDIVIYVIASNLTGDNKEEFLELLRTGYEEMINNDISSLYETYYKELNYLQSIRPDAPCMIKKKSQEDIIRNSKKKKASMNVFFIISIVIMIASIIIML